MIKSIDLLQSLRVLEGYIDSLEELKLLGLSAKVNEQLTQNIVFAIDLKDKLVSLFPTIPLKQWKSNSTPEGVNKIIAQSPSDP